MTIDEAQIAKLCSKLADCQQTDEVKEAKRMQSLEAKAQLYDRLQGRLDLDDEATNDLHQVDFIAKALANQDQGNLQTGLSSAHVQQFSSQPVKSAASLREPISHLSRLHC